MSVIGCDFISLLYFTLLCFTLYPYLSCCSSFWSRPLKKNPTSPAFKVLPSFPFASLLLYLIPFSFQAALAISALSVCGVDLSAVSGRKKLKKLKKVGSRYMVVSVSICLCVCLSMCLRVCLCVCLYVCLSVCLFMCLSVHVSVSKQSVFLPVCLLFCLHAWLSPTYSLSMCLPICLCVSLFLRLSICLCLAGWLAPIVCLSVSHFCVCLHVCLSVCLSGRLTGCLLFPVHLRVCLSLCLLKNLTLPLNSILIRASFLRTDGTIKEPIFKISPYDSEGYGFQPITVLSGLFPFTNYQGRSVG